MGIGRFAFTPILPLMQEAHGLTLATAPGSPRRTTSATLLGACVSFVLTPRAGAVRAVGLACGRALHAGDGLCTDSLRGGWLLRCWPGWRARSFSWGPRPGRWRISSFHRRSDLAGWVFAGVGVGICLAGAVALVAGGGRRRARAGWVLLGASRSVVAAPPGRACRCLALQLRRSRSPRRAAARPQRLAAGRLLRRVRLRLHHPCDLHPGRGPQRSSTTRSCSAGPGRCSASRRRSRRSA